MLLLCFTKYISCVHNSPHLHMAKVCACLRACVRVSLIFIMSVQVWTHRGVTHTYTLLYILIALCYLDIAIMPTLQALGRLVKHTDKNKHICAMYNVNAIRNRDNGFAKQDIT